MATIPTARWRSAMARFARWLLGTPRHNCEDAAHECRYRDHEGRERCIHDGEG